MRKKTEEVLLEIVRELREIINHNKKEMESQDKEIRKLRADIKRMKYLMFGRKKKEGTLTS